MSLDFVRVNTHKCVPLLLKGLYLHPDEMSIVHRTYNQTSVYLNM